MKKRIDLPIYKGMELNRDLLVTFSVTYELDGQYQTIVEKPNGITSIKQCYSLSISTGFQKSRMFCPGTQFMCFVSILQKSIKLIQDNIYNIFPSIGKINWDDVDRRELERFQTEKCMYLNGFSIIPIIYTTAFNECFPGIRITTKSNDSIDIPFEDAILISEVLSKIEPSTLSITILKMMLSNNIK